MTQAQRKRLSNFEYTSKEARNVKNTARGSTGARDTTKRPFALSHTLNPTKLDHKSSFHMLPNKLYFGSGT